MTKKEVKGHNGIQRYSSNDLKKKNPTLLNECSFASAAIVTSDTGSPRLYNPYARV